MKLPMYESGADDEEGDVVFLLVLEGSIAINRYAFTAKQTKNLIKIQRWRWKREENWEDLIRKFARAQRGVCVWKWESQFRLYAISMVTYKLGGKQFGLLTFISLRFVQKFYFILGKKCFKKNFES